MRSPHMHNIRHETGGARRAQDDSASAEVVAKLIAVYAVLDRETAALGASCKACGECCTFPAGGPVLYATMLERSVLSSVAASEGEDLLPGACPYWDATTKRCTARQRRVVGCRTHFCDDALASPTLRAAAHELCEAALDDIRRICEEHGLAWDYAGVIERLPRPGRGE